MIRPIDKITGKPWPVFCCSERPISYGMGWFRVFGYGLWLKDSSRHRLYFSQRNSLERFLRVGSWLIGVVRP